MLFKLDIRLKDSMRKKKGNPWSSLASVAVNTRIVLAIVPPQGCEAILIEILQSKRSAGGPHFTRCFLNS